MSDAHEGHLAAAYANDWSDLLGKADLWIYGHTHVEANIHQMWVPFGFQIRAAIQGSIRALLLI